MPARDASVAGATMPSVTESTYAPPECPAGHGPMSLLTNSSYRRLHVCTADGCGRSAFSEEAPPRPHQKGES